MAGLQSIVHKYKGSAPQAADAACYARARKNAAKTCERAERRSASFDANSKLIMPRAAFAGQIVLCCVVCLLAVSRSDR